MKEDRLGSLPKKSLNESVGKRGEAEASPPHPSLFLTPEMAISILYSMLGTCA